jgi:hypothetical protein
MPEVTGRTVLATTAFVRLAALIAAAQETALTPAQMKTPISPPNSATIFSLASRTRPSSPVNGVWPSNACSAIPITVGIKNFAGWDLTRAGLKVAAIAFRNGLANTTRSDSFDHTGLGFIGGACIQVNTEEHPIGAAGINTFGRAPQSELDYLTSSRAAMTSLAENYVGFPILQ